MDLTTQERTLLRWLRLAGDYSRCVWGPELHTALSLEAKGLAKLERRDDSWFATVVPETP